MNLYSETSIHERYKIKYLPLLENSFSWCLKYVVVWNKNENKTGVNIKTHSNKIRKVHIRLSILLNFFRPFSRLKTFFHTLLVKEYRGASPSVITLLFTTSVDGIFQDEYGNKNTEDASQCSYDSLIAPNFEQFTLKLTESLSQKKFN